VNFLYIGIDLGKAAHIAAFLSADLLVTHKRFRSCPTLPVPNSSAGFEHLLATIEKYSTRAETCVLVEHTGHYGYALIQYLQEHGVTVYHMQVHVRHQWDKTDVKDAQALGNLLYNTVAMGVQTADKTQRIARLEPLPEVVRRLRGLVRHRYELVSESTQRKNKLTAICDQLFPEFTQIYKDPNKESALTLREKYPTPRAVADASIDDLCATRARHTPSREKLGLLQKLAAESIGTHDEARRYSLALEQRQLIAELRLIQKHIGELEEQIDALTVSSREGQILQSFGIGRIQAGILVSGICPISNFETPAKLKGYVGWAPRRIQTGTTLDKMTMQHRGNRMLKQATYMIVVNFLKDHEGHWRKKYDRLVERKCNYDGRLKKYTGTMKVIARIAGDLLASMWLLLRKDYDLLQSLEPGQEPPAPELYGEKRHHVQSEPAQEESEMKNPEKGARVWVKLDGAKTAGIVLDTAFSSEGDYMQVKVELLAINPLAPEQLLRQIYPKPIQSYKLTKRYVTLTGEEVQL
jgi:transposase